MASRFMVFSSSALAILPGTLMPAIIRINYFGIAAAADAAPDIKMIFGMILRITTGDLSPDQGCFYSRRSLNLSRYCTECAHIRAAGKCTPSSIMHQKEQRNPSYAAPVQKPIALVSNHMWLAVLESSPEDACMAENTLSNDNSRSMMPLYNMIRVQGGVEWSIRKSILNCLIAVTATQANATIATVMRTSRASWVADCGSKNVWAWLICPECWAERRNCSIALIEAVDDASVGCKRVLEELLKIQCGHG
ncbi:uncharacterized protein TRIVIDRAFT_201038 [Trichoderma virens Gv29-8]|uniref:Uncharacterized protein n=1 Tax=Hypocrea virens (strain Gv29-8 / FGSC 10586) TaxID=413071 RepID=G9MRN3_HYPVG|nr:uncharacterized protein TRIVIDRAFT_201038 [Trichoderma virens Gv29-8]EHK22754.1 hypothetical protein TRIVIDRAFT_201038 [Trichoderma virens Gv29-8]